MDEEQQNDQQPRDELIGKRLGQFTILEEIGRGGMATVYRARQESVNRIVAVKVLPPSFLHDPGFLERFNREVDVASHLEHPHILPIYDYGEAEGVPYIAMRYLGGGSMADLVRRGVPPLESLVKPLTQVTQALDYAHQQSIIHRDLKPGNIMLDEAGNAYLSDFGIVHVFGSNLTGSMIVGTPAYMSPEQAKGLSIDSRSDIYALGIVLFELITGSEPYHAETPMGLLLKHINEPLPSPRALREGVPEAVEAVILKATAKEPDERYVSAVEMGHAFREAVQTGTTAPTDAARTRRHHTEAEPATAIPTPTPAPSAEPLKPGTGEHVGPAGEAARTRRRRSWVFGLLLIVVVAAVAVAALVLSGGIPPTSAVPTPQPAIPTPFSRASTIQQPLYSISMLDAWMPELAEFDNQSTTDRTRHVWRDEAEEVVLSLAFVDDDVTVEDYEDRFFDSENARFIDEVVAENGTLRRSYRVGPQTGYTAPGQVDHFYFQGDGRLAVLSMYTADHVAADPQLLDRLQRILDSLRLDIDEDTGEAT